jgi:hypothetical protein
MDKIASRSDATEKSGDATGKRMSLTKELTTENWNPSKVTHTQRRSMKIEKNGIVSDGMVTVEMHNG